MFPDLCGINTFKHDGQRSWWHIFVTIFWIMLIHEHRLENSDQDIGGSESVAAIRRCPRTTAPHDPHVDDRILAKHPPSPVIKALGRGIKPEERLPTNSGGMFRGSRHQREVCISKPHRWSTVSGSSGYIRAAVVLHTL